MFLTLIRVYKAIYELKLNINSMFQGSIKLPFVNNQIILEGLITLIYYHLSFSFTSAKLKYGLMNIFCWLIKELISDTLLFAAFNFNIFLQSSFYGLLDEGPGEGTGIVSVLPFLFDTDSTEEDFVCKYCIFFETMISLVSALPVFCKYMQSIFADKLIAWEI